jgi:Sel1 repeat
MKSLRDILLFAVVVSTDLCLAQQPAPAPSADRDERVDISTELQGPIDMKLLVAGEKVILNVLRDARMSSAITLPKGTKLTAKVTLMRPCRFAGASANSAMALLVNEANWKGQNILLRGYLWGPITSIELVTKLTIANEQVKLARIGATGADPMLGSVIKFGCTEVPGLDCYQRPASRGCAQQRFESGSTLVVRHLPSRYQLSLLYDDNAYAVARAAEVGAQAGSADAAYELAQRLHNGDLFVRDDAQALRWFSMAAEDGHLAAQRNLAVFLAEGLGTTAPDPVAAYKWFAVSVGRGVEQNKAALHKLEQMLAPERVAEGKRLSAEWLQAHSKQQ